jgi:hypothetical protein
MSKKPEQMTLDLFREESIAAIEEPRKKERKTGTHILPLNVPVYFSSNNQALCWITRSAAYCDKLKEGRVSKIRLTEELRIYRDGESRTLAAGTMLYIDRKKLIKV